jgi:hypothetical protein
MLGWTGVSLVWVLLLCFHFLGRGYIEVCRINECRTNEVRLYPSPFLLLNSAMHGQTGVLGCQIWTDDLDRLTFFFLIGFKGQFTLWPNFQRRSVWTNENAKFPKVVLSAFTLEAEVQRTSPPKEPRWQHF